MAELVFLGNDTGLDDFSQQSILSAYDKIVEGTDSTLCYFENCGFLPKGIPAGYVLKYDKFLPQMINPYFGDGVSWGRIRNIKEELDIDTSIFKKIPLFSETYYPGIYRQLNRYTDDVFSGEFYDMSEGFSNEAKLVKCSDKNYYLMVSGGVPKISENCFIEMSKILPEHFSYRDFLYHYHALAGISDIIRSIILVNIATVLTGGGSVSNIKSTFYNYIDQDKKLCYVGATDAMNSTPYLDFHTNRLFYGKDIAESYGASPVSYAYSVTEQIHEYGQEIDQFEVIREWR